MKHRKLAIALACLLAPSLVRAGQVPNPVNAPASVTSGNIGYWNGTSPQNNFADSGHAFGTSGGTVGLLNGNNTYSGNDIFSGTDNFTGTLEIGGTALGSAATQNTGTSGATLCLLNANCTFSTTDTLTFPDTTTWTSSGHSHVIDAGNASCNAAWKAVQTNGSGQQSCGSITGTSFHPGFQSGLYYTAPFASSLTSSAILANDLWAVPFYAPVAQTFTKESIDVTANVAASHCELGIYNNSGGVPGSLLLDAGPVSTAANGSAEITGLSIALNPGWYWLVMGCDNAISVESANAGSAAGLQSWLAGMTAQTTTGNQIFASWTYAANSLPGSFPTVARTAGPDPLVYLRF